MNRLKVLHRWSGFLLLFLVIVTLQAAREGLRNPGSGDPFPSGSVFIQVEGDVKRPGVYGFRGKPRLGDLLDKAGFISSGNPLPNDASSVPFTSGRAIFIRLGEKGYGHVQREMTAFYKVTLGIPLSLNHESEEGLTALPGIGRGLARAIVDVRSQSGGFKNIDELLHVKGIGRNLYVRIRPYLTL